MTQRERAPGLPVTVLRPGERPVADPVADAKINALNDLGQVRAAITTVAVQFTGARGGQPLCKEGCGKCCEVNTPVMSGLEAALSAGRMQVSAEALQRARDWLLAREPDVTLYPEQRPRVLGGDALAGLPPEQKRQLERERFTLSTRRCPFLREDASCALYEGRPLACRMYGIGVAPDPYCERPLDVHETLHPGKRSYDRSFGEAVEATVEQVLRRAEQADPSYGLGGFAPTMVYATVERAEFARLVESGQVALAKLGVLRPGQHYPGILSQRRREAYGDVLRQQRSAVTASS